MPDQSDRAPSSTTFRQIAVAFRLVGWTSLWIQLVLGVVSILVLLFASVSRNLGTEAQKTPGTGFGSLLAVAGVITLGLGVYLAFRCTQIGKQLQSPDANQRPRKADTIQILRFSLIVNLVGMLVTIIGAQAIVGALILRSLSVPQGVGAAFTNPNEIIRPVDIFVVQANTNTVAAHWVGVVASLFLLNRVSGR